SGQVQGFSLSAAPASQAIEAAGSATYQLNVIKIASNFSSTVTLTTSSSLPNLLVSLSPGSLTPPSPATLTLTDTHIISPLIPGVWHNLLVTAVGGGFTRAATVSLLVGGTRAYLPLILK
ncbi:MAG: hypothetical protein HYR94_25215, partial [Chloroflexi bacterium]|nr:hypothetical protein [Chloroflexota bacterium]